MADEQEITSDESAAAEPEIEADESPEQEAEKEPDESAAAEGDGDEAGCPVRMGDSDDLMCGRKLHVAPDGTDEEPVCLMHSKDPDKQSGPLFDTFWSEFERILEAAEENEAHFEGFVFPQIDLRGRKFQAICRFDHATFTQDTDFCEVTFSRDAIFSEADFTQGASFYSATFTQDADFRLAIFEQVTDFSDATFTKDADFRLAIVKQGTSFNDATFTKKADFSEAIFKQNTYFCEATFTQDATFWEATFTQDANFSLAAFTQEAYLSRATFTQDADFDRATFMQAARFVETEFHGTANWMRSRFLDQAEFRSTKFEPLVEGEASAVFAFARFSKPSEIVFDDVDLSRALFRNCDVSQVWFTSSVQWGKREGNRGFAVFEEKIPLEQEILEPKIVAHELMFLEGLQRNGQRDYRAVAQIYQQLKKNYDSRLDYWTANEFHYGEMEMKRLAGPTDGPLLGLRRWLHRRLSLIALYRWASDYGNSYGKPMVWLLGILILFAALLSLPGVGLKRQGVKQAETYASVWDVQKSYGENLWTEARLAGKGAITSVDTATFQKSAEYAPAYPWGRVLAIFETLLTSSLFALFLLAIRRQFRR